MNENTAWTSRGQDTLSDVDEITRDYYEREIARLKKRADDAWAVINSDYWRNRYDEDMALGNAYVAILRERLRSALAALKKTR